MSSMEVKFGPKHVAVLAFPFGSHAGPLLSLIQGIATKAPHVKFSFFSTSRSNASIFSVQNNNHDFHNIKAYNVHDGLPEGYVPSGHPLEPMNLFINAMPQNYRLAMDEAVAKTGLNFTCLVTDAFLWFGADMAEEMHLKWVPLWTAGPHSIFVHVLTDLIRERVVYNGGNQNQNIDFLPGFSSVKVSDLPEGIVDDSEQQFSAMLLKMGLMLPRATVVAINSFVALDPLIVNELDSKFQRLLNVGPFTLTTPQPSIPDEQECLKWLDKHEKASVVYISFGSVILPPPPELIALAEALEECDVPFIWAFRGNLEKQLRNGGFLERTQTRGKVVTSWVPQTEILKHSAIGVCVTHCGWNSILECVVGGVPMICRPFFGDQKLNTRMVENMWGIGVQIENGVFTKEATMRALELTMASGKGKVMRHKIGELKKSAMEAVEPSGSSQRDFNTLIQIVTS